MARRKLRQLGRLFRSFIAYQRRRTHNLPPPFRLWIEPTNVCNLKCGFMSFETFAAIIHQCKDYVFDVNLHHRGESLLHRDLGEMIQLAKQSGVLTNLHTNANLLTEQKALEILDSGLDLISFSFLGYDAETHERLSNEGDFERTLGNVIGFLRLRAEHRRSSPFTIVQTLTFPSETDAERRRARKDFRGRLAGLAVDRFVEAPAHNFA